MRMPIKNTQSGLKPALLRDESPSLALGPAVPHRGAVHLALGEAGAARPPKKRSKRSTDKTSTQKTAGKKRRRGEKLLSRDGARPRLGLSVPAGGRDRVVLHGERLGAAGWGRLACLRRAGHSGAGFPQVACPVKFFCDRQEHGQRKGCGSPPDRVLVLSSMDAQRQDRRGQWGSS
jgi:hypothetical protein